MTKSKNDIESLFGKLLGSSNTFNTISTFNQNAKDIFKNENFNIEDINEELNNIVDNISNTIDKEVEDLKDSSTNGEINKSSSKHKACEEDKNNKELSKQIVNEVSNIAKNIANTLENYEEKQFNLQDIGRNLSSNKLKEAMVLTEILGKPISKRRRNRSRGYRQL